MVQLDLDVVLKILAGIVLAWITARIIYSLRPPEEKDPNYKNPFLQKQKKQQLKQLPKPSSGVKYLYRLARASEPTRSGRKGDKKEQRSNQDTVGFEAQDMASRPLILRPSDGGYYGVSGLDDQCLHLSTAAQVTETAKLYFKGVEDLILLKFSTEMIEKDENVILRWEESLPQPGAAARSDAFPHVYTAERGVKARLSWWDLANCVALPMGSDGVHTFPEDALSEDAPMPDMMPQPPKVNAPAQAPAAAAVDELTALEDELRKEMFGDAKAAAS